MTKDELRKQWKAFSDIQEWSPKDEAEFEAVFAAYDAKQAEAEAQKALENWRHRLYSLKDNMRAFCQKYLDGEIDANNAHARVEVAFHDFLFDNGMDNTAEITNDWDNYLEVKKIYNSVIDTLPKKTELKDNEKSLIALELEIWKKTDEGKKYASLMQEMTAAFYEHLKKNSK
jgi:plasmid stabilization system protein ParE